jgi:hypothetical protein
MGTMSDTGSTEIDEKMVVWGDFGVKMGKKWSVFGLKSGGKDDFLRAGGHNGWR